MSGWTSVRMVIPMAMAPTSDGPLIPAIPAGVLGDRCRAAVSRMRQVSLDTYEAMNTMLDAIVGLEREVQLLKLRLHLASVGIELKNELVQIGADGLFLQREIRFPEGTEMSVHMDLNVWGSERLMAVTAVAHHEDGGTRLAFVNMQQHQRDSIVALVFQEQGRERRHAVADLE